MDALQAFAEVGGQSRLILPGFLSNSFSVGQIGINLGPMSEVICDRAIHLFQG